MSRLAALFACAFAVLTACSPSPPAPRFTRSCRGEYVDACRPYTYARVTSATLTPSRIRVDDPTMRAQVHVEFERCGMAPLPLTVQIAAFVPGAFAEPDGGSSDGRVFPLTTIGPAASGATSIDVMIDNPFFANAVPADSNITLQFAPIIDDCEGDLFSLDYHTGVAVIAP